MSIHTEANPFGFSIQSKQINETLTCVSAQGDVDAATAPELKRTLLDLIGDGHYAIIVDLSDVTYIDSTGLGVLLGVLRRVREHEGRLHLVCPNMRIKKLLAITGLNNVFDNFSTVDEVVAATKS